MLTNTQPLRHRLYLEIYNIQNPVKEDLRNFFRLFHTLCSEYFIQMWKSPSDIPLAAHFETLCFGDIFIRYKLKLKKNKGKEKEKNVKKKKKRNIYRRISTIVLSSVKFAVSAAVKIIDNDNWIGSQAKAFTNLCVRARARIYVCVCVCVLSIFLLNWNFFRQSCNIPSCILR